MRGFIVLRLLFIALGSVSSRESPLNGKHLTILPGKMPVSLILTRNETGHVTKTAGVLSELLDYLQRDLNFSYSFYLEDGWSSSKDAIDAMERKNADMILATLFPTPESYKALDYPYPFLYSSLGLMIKIPQSITNMRAIVQPWKPEVWLVFILSIGLGCFIIWILSQILSRMHSHFSGNAEVQYDFDSFGNVFLYVLRTIFMQGVTIRDQRLPIRVMLVFWIVSISFMILSYSSTLISFVSSPLREPVIDSVYDIAENPGLKLVVYKGHAPDVAFTAATSGIHKSLGDMLREDSGSRCLDMKECYMKMQEGSNVFIHADFVLQNMIYQDKERTGECHFMMAKNTFANTHLYIGVPKKSPYLQAISEGIQRATESGLLNYWIKKYTHDVKECQQKYRETSTNTSLSLMNLGSAFIILLVGCILSVFAFIAEICKHSFFKI